MASNIDLHQSVKSYVIRINYMNSHMTKTCSSVFPTRSTTRWTVQQKRITVHLDVHKGTDPLGFHCAADLHLCFGIKIGSRLSHKTFDFKSIFLCNEILGRKKDKTHQCVKCIKVYTPNCFNKMEKIR